MLINVNTENGGVLVVATTKNTKEQAKKKSYIGGAGDPMKTLFRGYNQITPSLWETIKVSLEAKISKGLVKPLTWADAYPNETDRDKVVKEAKKGYPDLQDLPTVLAENVVKDTFDTTLLNKWKGGTEITTPSVRVVIDQQIQAIDSYTAVPLKVS